MSTTEQTNEAAERLCRQLALQGSQNSPGQRLLDKALAAERRATVERIREAFMRRDAFSWKRADVIRAILDEEAAR